MMQFQIETGQKVVDLEGHNGDVAALSLKPDDRNVFATGSVDRTARIWDLRAPGIILGQATDNRDVKDREAEMMACTIISVFLFL